MQECAYLKQASYGEARPRRAESLVGVHGSMCLVTWKLCSSFWLSISEGTSAGEGGSLGIWKRPWSNPWRARWLLRSPLQDPDSWFLDQDGICQLSSMLGCDEATQVTPQAEAMLSAHVRAVCEDTEMQEHTKRKWCCRFEVWQKLPS